MKHAVLMIYVENVKATQAFWTTYLGFTVEKTLDLGPSQSVVLNLEDNFRVQLFEKSFIEQVSPEVSLAMPSIAIYVDNLEDYHQEVARAGLFISDISEHAGQRSFNFQDNEGHYLAAIER
ncbi:VOC family protein [Vagococcus zengguangii]|uniref:Uncharacterized protein n=1 Tax=Vagococcus zengguangii TaxID=2571750 RepID=A0A4D7CVI1_9ENTE|nr:VOC family protein [Vagococcus zengguangii]QCI86250.1 hypothetical protein FA707_04405 [Vagococcus zengguangii]TLG79641.1 hypothetical protein FE258_08035 [Vagococcus zengguangii]